MSLVKQLRDEIVDSNVPPSGVLRKAKILAATLGDAELELWLSNELNGYGKDSTLPPTRLLNSPLLGTFHGFRGSVTSFGIPLSMLPEWMRENVTELPIAQPLRELESMAASSSDTWRHTWPTEAVMVARQTVQMSGGMALVELYQPITKAMMEGVIDGTRTRFLDFLLGLQKINKEVMDSESAISNLPAEAVNTAFHVNVYGDNNVVASQSELSTISITSIKHGDFRTLRQHLASLQVPTIDIEALEGALTEDGVPQEPRKLGPRVGRWIGDMVTKSASGAWKSTIGVASKVLTDAVFEYYGWKS